MYRRLRDTAEVKRIQALKALFKKVIRMVSLNNPWKDSDDDHKVTSYVKRNISTRVRSRPRTGFLTAAEKTIIRTPHVRRTIPERMKLCSLFAKLRCLARFTPKLRARLVPVLRLMPVDAGRIIIRQSDVPITVFFVISGEVHMIQDNDKEENEVVKGILGPGDMMGDVELIEGIKRTRTFRAATYCELLVLFDYDFAPILGPHMTKIWDEKKRALKALDYFDFLDDDQIVEACRFGRLKQFHPLDTIYCDDIGSMTNVHFVLSGECLILQCLNMSVSLKKGKKVFQLMPTTAGDVSKMFRQGVRSTLVSPSKSENLSKIDIVDIVESSSTSAKENGHNSTLNRTTPVVESHFIDVGTLTFGGIFGLGETMEHRVIMARTTVQCLTLPRFFLLEKKQNPGNIWERRLLYMDCMIPSREALFAHYLKACDWKKFKNDFIRESLKPSDNDVTHVGDIPIICKIVETSDDVE
ncbi:uncharacterized protein LOC128251873 isoform X2 [Drosophila gunungcola]|uniref:uncharacterized protein LOC128251873 isoform X2 n=1 Tax=Drosophila gunungcola TaxID=103775 RepID=UPI0022E66387|nr:uncharacterized protein LOC128251873 isoform X2 [Drosophila gunungcola]